MANGDFALNGLDPHRWAIKLLDGQSASHTGVWVEVPAWFNIRSFWTNITAETSGSPTIEIMISNASTKPADATDGALAFAALTPALPAATAVMAYRWVKAKKTAGGTPVATDVIMEAARNE
jgi:hypothetical protein